MVKSITCTPNNKINNSDVHHGFYDQPGVELCPAKLKTRVKRLGYGTKKQNLIGRKNCLKSYFSMSCKLNSYKI